jgi:hypothetical protein
LARNERKRKKRERKKKERRATLHAITRYTSGIGKREKERE